MIVAVFGAGGMLGRAVVAAAEAAGHKPVIGHWDITSRKLPGILEACKGRGVQVAINCAGVIPQRDPGPKRMIAVNALGPLNLIKACRAQSIPLVHVSTDCVFSGEGEGRIYVGQRPDPIDLYGRTKLLGEMIADRAAVVRTSFIGPDHGLMRWLLDQPEGAEVEGWLGASWTGSSVYAVASALVQIAESGGTGLMHLATSRVYSKCDIVEALVERLGLQVKVRRVFQPMINRALEPTHLLPEFEEVIEELCSRSRSP